MFLQTVTPLLPTTTHDVTPEHVSALKYKKSSRALGGDLRKIAKSAVQSGYHIYPLKQDQVDWNGLSSQYLGLSKSSYSPAFNSLQFRPQGVCRQ